MSLFSKLASLIKARRVAYAVIALVLIGATSGYAFSGTPVFDWIIPGSSVEAGGQEEGDSDGEDSSNSAGSPDGEDSSNSPGSPDGEDSSASPDSPSA